MTTLHSTLCDACGPDRCDPAGTVEPGPSCREGAVLAGVFFITHDVDAAVRPGRRGVVRWPRPGHVDAGVEMRICAARGRPSEGVERRVTEGRAPSGDVIGSAIVNPQVG